MLSLSPKWRLLGKTTGGTVFVASWITVFGFHVFDFYFVGLVAPRYASRLLLWRLRTSEMAYLDWQHVYEYSQKLAIELDIHLGGYQRC